MILYETLSQPFFLLKIISVGVICGFIFDIGGFIHFLCNKNKIMRNILDFVCVLLSTFLFFWLVQSQSYGEFRLYIVLCFVFAIILEQITIGKLLAKTYVWCYTVFRKFGKLLIKTREKLNGKNNKKN